MHVQRNTETRYRCCCYRGKAIVLGISVYFLACVCVCVCVCVSVRVRTSV